jgi:tetratricopeptide (TPR) repeat protein
MGQQLAVGGHILGATKRRILILGCFFLLVSPYALGQTVPLDQTEILGRLAAGNTPSYVAHLVKTRGVSFSVSQDFLYRVKLAGGEGILAERLLSVEESGQPHSVSENEASFERLAQCAELIHAGSTDLAEKECRISIEENPQSPWPLLATARLLQHYDLTGNLVETSRENPEERRELLWRAAKLGPNLAMVHQALATTLDSGEAATELENAKRFDAEQLEVSETIAQEIPRIAYVGGDEQDSDATAASNEPAMIDPETARHVEVDPDLASNHRRLALRYLQVGNFEKGESEFAEAIRLEPDNPSIRSDLAVYYLSRHNPQEALAELREGVRIVPFGIVQRIFLAETLESFGDTPEAINELQNLTAMYPAATAASESLVELYLEQKDPRAAIEELQRSLKASSATYSDQSKFVEARYQDLNRLAHLLTESRDLDAAAEQYLLLLRYAPDSALLHNDYGNVLLKQRKLDQAVGEYNEAIRLDPSVSGAHHSIEICLAMKKDLAGAMGE